METESTLPELGTFNVYDSLFADLKSTDIAEEFESYHDLISSSEFDEYFKISKAEREKSMMIKVGDNINEEHFKVISEYCNIDKLTCNGEIEELTKNSFEWCKEPCDPNATKNVSLHTYLHTKKRNSLRSYKKNFKYKSEKPIVYELAKTLDNDPTVKPFQDILVYIRVYLPFSSRTLPNTGGVKKLTVNYVVGMLGSQTLDKLRDVINCPSNLSISTESSKKALRADTKNAEEVYKSGFFFIENTFYNDFRDSSNSDNSEVIRKWAETNKLGKMQTAKMEETRIDSLKLRFGYPWVYQHQGECEHLIIFSDARFVNPEDDLDIECYPRIMRIRPNQSRYCMMCGMYSVAWITLNNSRVPHNPCFFCESCFKSYNYIKNKKVGEFQAFPYPNDASLYQHETVMASNFGDQNDRKNIKDIHTEKNDSISSESDSD